MNWIIKWTIGCQIVKELAVMIVLAFCAPSAKAWFLTGSAFSSGAYEGGNGSSMTGAAPAGVTIGNWGGGIYRIFMF